MDISNPLLFLHSHVYTCTIDARWLVLHFISFPPIHELLYVFILLLNHTLAETL